MFFLFALIAAALAWFTVGRGLFARTGLPTRDILYADVGSTFPQPTHLPHIQTLSPQRKAGLPGSGQRRDRSGSS